MLDEPAFKTLHEVLFRHRRSHVYAVLDGASVPDLVPRLAAGKQANCCLFSGDLSPDLAAAAPYLVQLDPAAALTRALLTEGWRGHWGIYACVDDRVPFMDMRRHFRRFLMVRSPEGESVYFRFYDPRVFRVYLPTCNEKEMEHVYGPVKFFGLEDADGSVLRVWKHTLSPRVEKIPLGAGVGAGR
ncbi:MAG: DUF4123 domain-containing protein [Phycisphaerales bacterium]|nr:MAG: DUF4123 domain-containing protein [Phycisphaerales bacterium]